MEISWFTKLKWIWHLWRHILQYLHAFVLSHCYCCLLVVMRSANDLHIFYKVVSACTSRLLHRDMSWVVFHTNDESKLSQRVLKEAVKKENKGSELDSSFLDQFNSSKNGQTYCQNSNFWNWFLNRKITFVFNSDFVQCLVLIESSHTRWRKYRKRHKSGLVKIGT